MNKIEFKNVYYSYNKNEYVLFDINSSFFNNDIIFIMGESGSGKSTLIQQINALLKPKEGHIKLQFNSKEYLIDKSKKEKRMKEIRSNLGLLFQFPEHQLFEINVLKDVSFAPLNYYRDEKKAEEMAISALNKVGIDEKYYDRSIFELSGGEKRKVAIAGILAFNPSVLILDEPTSSLDAHSKNELMNLILKLKNDGKMVIIVSHDEDLCYEYADKVILLSKGKIIYDGNNKKLWKQESLLRQANLEKPFLYKIKEKLNIESSFSTIDKLLSIIKEKENE